MWPKRKKVESYEMMNFHLFVPKTVYIVTFILRVSIIFDERSFYIILSQLLTYIVRNGTLFYFHETIQMVSTKILIASSVT